MMMGVTKLKCKSVCDLLPEYCSGELPAAKVEDVKAHIVQCESCRRELAIMSRAINALKAPVTQYAPPNLLAAVKTMARAQKAQRRADFFNWSIATVAACALLAWIVVHSQWAVAPNTIARFHNTTPSAPMTVAAVPTVTHPAVVAPIVADKPIVVMQRPLQQVRVAYNVRHSSRAARRSRTYWHPVRQMIAMLPASSRTAKVAAPIIHKTTTIQEVIPEAEHTPQVASAGNYYKTNDGYVRIEIPLPDKGERVCVATMPSTTR
jgi:hypothetical protein